MRPDGAGQLVLVATPIGNLGDLSPRAREVLADADLICCEDTRRIRALLSAMGIPAGGSHGDRLMSLHTHNEVARLERVAACVSGGGVVAVVSEESPGRNHVRLRYAIAIAFLIGTLAMLMIWAHPETVWLEVSVALLLAAGTELMFRAKSELALLPAGP